MFKHFSLCSPKSRALQMSEKLPTSWKQGKSWSELFWNWSLLWDLLCLIHVLIFSLHYIMNIHVCNDSSACLIEHCHWLLSTPAKSTQRVEANRITRWLRHSIWTERLQIHVCIVYKKRFLFVNAKFVLVWMEFPINFFIR